MNISVIFWFHSTFPESFPEGPLGGAERASWEISRRLAKRHNVRLVCKSDDGGESSEIEGVELVRVRPRGTKWVSSDDYFWQGLANRDVDVVHSITALEPCLYSERSVLHLENDIRLYSPFPSAKRRAYAKQLSGFQMVIGVSNHVMTKCLESFDLNASRKAVMLNGANLEVFNPLKRDRPGLRERYGIGEDELVVIYSGYLARKKGLHILLDALDGVREDYKLIVAGGSFYSIDREFDNRYAERICNRISGMPSVIHVGALDQSELSVLYASSDVCVVPSIWQDPCPLVVAEGAASGLPILGTRNGGIPDAIVDGKTGILTSSEPSEIGAALTRILVDDGLRRRMSRNSRAFAERHLDWDRITERIEKAYGKME